MKRLILTISLLSCSGMIQAQEQFDSVDAVEAAVCIDADGDGWGWNGAASCLIPLEEDIGEVPVEVVAEFIQQRESEDIALELELASPPVAFEPEVVIVIAPPAVIDIEECTVEDQTRQWAVAKYRSYCPTAVVDCDPVGGIWYCSNIINPTKSTIGGLVVLPEVPRPVEVDVDEVVEPEAAIDPIESAIFQPEPEPEIVVVNDNDYGYNTFTSRPIKDGVHITTGTVH